MRSILTSQNPSHPCRGMSLLEVVVTVTLLLILSAIVIPITHTFIERSKGTQCIANLRHIGNGLNLAVADLGYYLGLRPVQHSATKDRWYQVIQFYMEGETILANDPLPNWLICPSLPSDLQRNSEPANLKYLGYGYNKDGFGNTSSDPYWQVSITRVQDPSKKIIIGDNRDQGGYSTMLYPGAAANQRTYRHNGGGHYLHADGHIQWWKAEDLTRELARDRYAIWYPYPPSGN